MKKTWRERKIDHLEKVNEYLRIALGEFTPICGGSYITSLVEFKKLVRVKLMLEDILKNTTWGLESEKRRLIRDERKT